jgi:hypothetical protein
MNFYIELLPGFVLGRTESPTTRQFQTLFQRLQLPKVAGPGLEPAVCFLVLSLLVVAYFPWDDASKAGVLSISMM